MRLFSHRLALSVAALGLSAAALVGAVPLHAHAHADGAVPADGPTITVFKSPTCGCCKGWVEHLQKHGFKVVARDVADVTPLKTAHGVPEALHTCHTALVAGYVIEGHVPADVIAKLLRERPKVAGLGVPGMPMGSPGMEGGRVDHYDILSFDKGGRTAVYAKR